MSFDFGFVDKHLDSKLKLTLVSVLERDSDRPLSSRLPDSLPPLLLEQRIELDALIEREHARLRHRAEQLWLAEVPSPDLHASPDWWHAHSGSRERTRAMLDVLGLVVVADLENTI